jgi:hypothetical protein
MNVPPVSSILDITPDPDPTVPISTFASFDGYHYHAMDSN